MKLLEAFGIDYQIILINLFNFAILLVILRKIAYKPILTFIEERKKTIAEGLINAESAKKLLADAEKEHQKMVTASHKEARLILERAREATLVQRHEIVSKAQLEAKQILEKARKEIDAERHHAMDAAKADIFSLVMMITEKVLEQKIDVAADKKLVSALIREAE